MKDYLSDFSTKTYVADTYEMVLGLANPLQNANQ